MVGVDLNGDGIPDAMMAVPVNAHPVRAPARRRSPLPAATAMVEPRMFLTEIACEYRRR